MMRIEWSRKQQEELQSAFKRMELPASDTVTRQTGQSDHVILRLVPPPVKQPDGTQTMRLVVQHSNGKEEEGNLVLDDETVTLHVNGEELTLHQAVVMGAGVDGTKFEETVVVVEHPNGKFGVMTEGQYREQYPEHQIPLEELKRANFLQQEWKLKAYRRA